MLRRAGGHREQVRIGGPLVSLVVVSALALTSCGGEPASLEVGGPASDDAAAGRRTDLSGVMPGRRPEIAVRNNDMVAYSGADHSMDRTESVLAVSRDAGRTFLPVTTGLSLYQPGVVLRDGEAVVVGVNCLRPVDPESMSCDSSKDQVVAFLVDLEARTATRLPDPPLAGFVTDSIGLGATGAAFNVATDGGPMFLALGEGGSWLTSKLPENTARVCVWAKGLIAVTKGEVDRSPAGDPTNLEPGSLSTVPDGAIRAIPRGEVAWSAHTSDDGGKSWSPPVDFVSRLDSDFNSTVGISCGSRFLAVYTQQMGIFDPSSATWLPVDVPAGARIVPGAAAAWLSDDAFKLWSPPNAEGGIPAEGAVTAADDPLLTHASITVSSMQSGSPHVEVGAPDTFEAGDPQSLRGAGAEAAGYILLVGERATLERISG